MVHAALFGAGLYLVLKVVLPDPPLSLCKKVVGGEPAISGPPDPPLWLCKKVVGGNQLKVDP